MYIARATALALDYRGPFFIMLFDARHLPRDHEIRADLCVIGAGAAGIALARELAGTKLRVCLLESGGFEFDEATQRLSEGTIAGLPYTPLEAARVRQFGGTTNHWGGWCRPLEESDFLPRPWIPESGWPFTRTTLDPYYERAQQLCEAGPYNYDPDFWTAQGPRPFDLDRSRIATSIFQLSPPTNFGNAYRQALLEAPNVDTYLFANVVELETFESGAAVRSVRVAAIGGNTAKVTADRFVLAAGGIENARLLLASRRMLRQGLGNTHDLVGRYFADHPGLFSGALALSERSPPSDLYTLEGRPPDLRAKIDGGSMEKFVTSAADKTVFLDWIERGAPRAEFDGSIRPILAKTCLNCHRPGGIAFFRPLRTYEETLQAIRRNERGGEAAAKGHQRVRGVLALAPSVAAREHLNHAAVLLMPVWPRRLVEQDGLWRSVRHLLRNGDEMLPILYRRYRQADAAPRDFHMLSFLEPTPNRASRVTLTNERDALGVPKVRLDWRLRDRDLQTLRRTHEILAAEFGRTGLGRVMVSLEEHDVRWPSELEHGWHHMGTTRMHRDPKCGVVDADCRVHGLDNLYVAGSSVFPTYGYAQPTLTIVALALRLAEHLQRRARSGSP